MDDHPGRVGLLVEDGEDPLRPEGLVLGRLKRHLQQLEDLQRLASLRRPVDLRHFRQQTDHRLDLGEREMSKLHPGLELQTLYRTCGTVTISMIPDVEAANRIKRK